MNGACEDCGRPLTPDDAGMTKKLVNRGAERFLCIPCLARRLNVSEALVRKKLEEFRAAGCTLFSKTQ